MALYFEIVQQIIMTILAAVVTLGGTFLALVKSGHIQIGKVKENGVSAKLEEISDNHLHSIAESLGRIEKLLGEIHENTIIIKTKQNGK